MSVPTPEMQAQLKFHSSCVPTHTGQKPCLPMSTSQQPAIQTTAIIQRFEQSVFLPMHYHRFRQQSQHPHQRCKLHDTIDFPDHRGLHHPRDIQSRFHQLTPASSTISTNPTEAPFPDNSRQDLSAAANAAANIVFAPTIVYLVATSLRPEAERWKNSVESRRDGK
ncbi:Hypothetical predicted protein [Cloeon dipterum]|uniref:Uncharacterized protein n=1 Tax=Cloeon dipterum TaxID=197152 RepID=A0A8S1DW47_9INSE|nr:Hypothetical predicted protein [Cloeon dipterum]